MTAHEIVMAACQEVLGFRPALHANLDDITDSLGRLEIGVEIENHVALPDEDEFKAATVADLVTAVEWATGERK